MGAGILDTLALLYGYAGRFTDARAAIRRAEGAHTRCGAKILAALGTIISGRHRDDRGGSAAAEPNLENRLRCAARDGGTRGFLPPTCLSLAEAAYALGRLGEANS